MAVLVSKRHHQGPMAAVLRRYNIGNPDKYDRGIWINKSDIPQILSCMENDPRKVVVTSTIFAVPGTCQHNMVTIDDFEKLFEK